MNRKNPMSTINPMTKRITPGLVPLRRRLPSGATGIGVPGPYRAGAATRYGERIHGSHDAVEVVVHAGGQARPDVLLALE